MASNITFPQYLKQSVEVRKNLDAVEAEKSEDITRQNYSALFCPSGFAIEGFGEERTPKDAFAVKFEEETLSDAK